MPFNNIPPPDDYTPKNFKNSTQFSRGGFQNRNEHHSNKRQLDVTESSSKHEETYIKAYQEQTPIQSTEETKRKKTIIKDRFHYEKDDYFSQIQDEEDTANPGEFSDDISEKVEPSKQNDDDEDEDDPLDAYMKSIEEGSSDIQKEDDTQETKESVDLSEKDDISIIYSSSSKSSQPKQTNKIPMQDRGVRLDIDDIDDTEEVYLNHLQQKSQTPEDESNSQDEAYNQQHDVDYDDEDNIIGVRKIKKEIEPLPSIDHSNIDYDTFVRNFYNEHPEIAKLTHDQGDELRAKLEIKVSGQHAPKPVCSFAHFNFDEQLMKVIRRSDYTQPTPIQAQAIPAALSGRNIIGIAQTGSGKTAAYLWPMIEHIMGQPDLKQGDGPIGLILVPTRELALQVYGQAKKFANSYNIAVVCAYGGGSKYEQAQDLESGAEIVVATPGRLIDLIKLKATNLRRVTYFVLDEADRFFDMGFEVQVKSICEQVRPDRQTLLFSATFKYKTEQLARRFIDDPIKIIQKTLGEVNEDVTQHVIILKPEKKWDWLLEHLVQFTSAGSILIFVTRITNAEELHKNLEDHGKETLLLHGDMEQSERNRVILSFKRKERDILIATDVAARGLDISHIKTVINYDVARDIDTHIHRIGRTGRAGTKGDAYTLVIDKDKDFAGLLVKNLETSNQKVDDKLLNLAMQSHNFRKARQQQQGNKNAPQQPKHHNKNNQHHYNRDDNSSHHNHNTNRYRHNNNQRFHDDAGPSSQNNNMPLYPYQNNRKSNEYDRKRARWN